MDKSKPALIGLFVVGAVVLLVVGLMAFGALRWLEPSQDAIVYFEEPLSGLTAGAPVTFRGIEIGSVQEVEIQGDVETLVVETLVHLRLRPAQLPFYGNDGEPAEEEIDIERLVQEGLKARLTLDSLVTRQLAIDLDFHPDEPFELRHPERAIPEIPSTRSGIAQAQEALEEFPWQDAMESIMNTLESLESLAQSLDKEVMVISHKVQETLDEGTALLSESRHTLQSGSEDLDRILASATRTMDHVERVAEEMNTLVHPRSEERDDLRRALRELSSAATAMRRFAEKVEQRPNVLLFDREEMQP